MSGLALIAVQPVVAPATALRAASLEPSSAGRAGDVTAFRVHHAATASAALADLLLRPTVASKPGHIEAVEPGSTTTVRLSNTQRRVTSKPSRVWFYARTGEATQLRVEVLSAGRVRTRDTVPVSSGMGWRSVQFSVSNAAAVNDLQLRFTAVGGFQTVVRATYAAMAGLGRTPLILRPNGDVSTPNDGAAAVNRYLSALDPLVAEPEMQARPVGAPSSDTSAVLPDGTAPSGKRRYQCVTTPYSLATSPDKIVALNPDSNKLWLGGLLQGQGYANGLGSLRELPIRKRAPMTIYTDLLGPSVSVKVDSPNPASVQQAISNLVNRAVDAQVPIPVRASFLQTEQQRSDQALLKLGFSAKYLGASASAKLDMSRNAQESTLLATFVQRMFTVSMVTPATPADYFSSDFTGADLQAQEAEGRIGPDNPPVVVSSISFGRTLLYSVTAAASTSELSGALDAAYSGGVASGSVDLSARQQEILNSARYQVVALGGAEGDVLPLIREHKLGDYFTSHSNPLTAVPISYQVNNIGNDSAARFTETSNYNLTECTALSNRAIVVGATVRLSRPRVYMDGSRSSADVYGNLTVNGETQWARPREAHQKIWLHTQADLDGWRQPNESIAPWQTDLRFGQPGNLSLRGSINCKLYFPEFGADPSNQYDWAWRIDGGGYGDVEIAGGSKSCPITLRTRVTKIRDLFEYEP